MLVIDKLQLQRRRLEAEDAPTGPSTEHHLDPDSQFRTEQPGAALARQAGRSIKLKAGMHGVKVAEALKLGLFEADIGLGAGGPSTWL